ncbi:hypothetical protein [Piscibacillus salipiscarius]|uniref:hypothetical protein n=1 Tax=Piscibacillus salipiscarius TaxID=299480 RepID=UPI0006D00B0B|nr:hypothetical protein [Piscibacillus salipiscarius]
MRKYLKLNRKLLPITMILLMLFSTWVNTGLITSIHADSDVEKSELEIEKEREKAFEEQDNEPNESEELKNILSGLGFTPKLAEQTPREPNAPPKIDKQISKQLQEKNK